MVYNPQLTFAKKHLTAILVGDLTSAQLDEIQHKFGIGAFLTSPFPHEQLYIHDKRGWASKSHAEMKREYPDTEPLLVIDAESAIDGGIWYIDGFASQEDVDEGVAENQNTLLKMRMKIEEVVITFVNYEISNRSIIEDLGNVGIDIPIPENFTSSDQDRLYACGLDYDKDRYIGGTYVTAFPNEFEESTDEKDRENFLPRPERVQRLKKSVAWGNALQQRWSVGSEARDIRLPDGSFIKFPEGSKIFRADYEMNVVVPRYERPDGSL